MAAIIDALDVGWWFNMHIVSGCTDTEQAQLAVKILSKCPMSSHIATS